MQLGEANTSLSLDICLATPSGMPVSGLADFNKTMRAGGFRHYLILLKAVDYTSSVHSKLELKLF